MLLGVFNFLTLSFVDVLDILVIAALIFAVFRWIRGTSTMYIFIAIIILLVTRVVANAIGMKMVSSVLGTVLDVGVVALIVIFQPEIRRFLNRIGRSAGNTLEKRSILDRITGRNTIHFLENYNITEICDACKEMSDRKTGALIVLPHRNPLDEIVATGDLVDAVISKRLINNIFFKNSPLHDGAMIIAGDRIMAARCTLPITDRDDIPARLGMRHKAAIGMSEQSDADVIVVSEETGEISFVRAGKVTPIESIYSLRLLLGGSSESESR